LLHIAKGKKGRAAIFRLSEAKSRSVLCNMTLVLFRFRARGSNFGSFSSNLDRPALGWLDSTTFLNSEDEGQFGSGC
jgi:hypothetical protein